MEVEKLERELKLDLVKKGFPRVYVTSKGEPIAIKLVELFKKHGPEEAYKRIRSNTRLSAKETVLFFQMLNLSLPESVKKNKRIKVTNEELKDFRRTYRLLVREEQERYSKIKPLLEKLVSKGKYNVTPFEKESSTRLFTVEDFIPEEVFANSKVNEKIVYVQFKRKFFKMYNFLRDKVTERDISDAVNAFRILFQMVPFLEDSITFLYLEDGMTRKALHKVSLYDNTLMLNYNPSSDFLKVLSDSFPMIKLTGDSDKRIKGHLFVNTIIYPSVLHYLILNESPFKELFFIREVTTMDHYRITYVTTKNLFTDRIEGPLLTFFFTSDFKAVKINVLSKGKKPLEEFLLILPYVLEKYKSREKQVIKLLREKVPDGAKLAYFAVETENLAVRRIVPKKQKRFSKLDQLKKKAPALFLVPGYSRSCQCPQQPVIIDEDEIKDWEDFNRVVFSFPPGDKRLFYFTCPTEKYKYPYYKLMRYNFPFKRVPCCRNMISNKKEEELIYERGLEQKIRYDYKLISQGVIEPDRLGNLSGEINILLKYVTGIKQNFYRFGVLDSPNSLVHSVFTALCKSNVFYHKNKESFCSAKTIDKKERIINLLREEIARFAVTAKQELYNLTVEEIRNRIVDKNVFLDSITDLRPIEEYFNVNIYVFTENGVEIPRYSLFHLRNSRKVKRHTVFLYRTNSVVNRKEHHYDPITLDSTKTFVFSKEAALMMEKIMENRYYFFDPFPRLNPFNGIHFRNIKEQRIDNYGKVRVILVEQNSVRYCVYVPPLQPTNAKLLEKVFAVDYNEVKKVLGKASKRSEDGVWYKIGEHEVFVPAFNIDNSLELSSVPSPMIEEKRYDDYKKKREARVLLFLIEWLWSLSGYEELDHWWKKNVEVADNRDTGDFKIETSRLPEVLSTEKGIEYLKDKWPSIFNEGKIRLYRELYNNCLNYFKLKQIDPFKKITHIENLWVNSVDFPVSDNVIMIDSIDHFEELKEKITNEGIIPVKEKKEENKRYSSIKDAASYIPIITRIKEEHVVKREPVPFLDVLTGRAYLIQNVKGGTLKNALRVATVWFKERINIGYSATWDEVLESELDYVVYGVTKEGTIVPMTKNRKIPYLELISYEKTCNYFAALLPL